MLVVHLYIYGNVWRVKLQNSQITLQLKEVMMGAEISLICPTFKPFGTQGIWFRAAAVWFGHVLFLLRFSYHPFDVLQIKHFWAFQETDNEINASCVLKPNIKKFGEFIVLTLFAIMVGLMAHTPSAMNRTLDFCLWALSCFIKWD
jgi:hypothetical protein